MEMHIDSSLMVSIFSARIKQTETIRIINILSGIVAWRSINSSVIEKETIKSLRIIIEPMITHMKPK